MYRFWVLGFLLVLVGASNVLAQDRHGRRRVTVRRPAAVRSVYRSPRYFYSRPSYRRHYRSYARSYAPPPRYYYQPRRAVPVRTYRSRSTSFGFSFSLSAPIYRSVVYAPAPVTYAPQPVYLESTPVVYQRLVVVTPPPVVEIQLPAGFAERERRYHKKGSDAGQLDWVKGRWNGQKVKLYFNPDGSVRKQKYDD